MPVVTIKMRSLLALAIGFALAIITMFALRAWTADAAPGDSDTTFVPISPCRLLDTRPDPDRVGPNGTLGADDTRTIFARGSNGNCTIPDDAVGLALNVTALNASGGTFLTFWPGGERPLASSLNPSPGEPPTPNAVATTLSDGGTFDMFNLAGSVDVLIDITGYYTKTSLAELNARLTALEQPEPVVMSNPPAFQRFSGATVPTLVTQIGHLFGASADNGIIIMAIDGPESIGATHYRLQSVEWCLATNATNSGFVTGAVVYHDGGSLLTSAVSDTTDRSTAGCYTLEVPPASPRGYSLALALTGQVANLTQAAVVIPAVRSTWVPA
jgi:hypothetical protein